MSTFKKTKVVLLPTNEKATVGSIVTRPSDNRMATVNVLTKDDTQPCIHQHLYFLSDDEIKEGDWYINTWGDGQPMLCKVNSKEEANDCNRLNYCCKKIIATTDKSLFTETKSIGYTEDRARVFYGKEYLPQPSQSFIEKFVEEYNKGNVITEVLVEYEPIGAYANPKYDSDYQLKINPKDNTITIRKVKDSWSREEVKQLFDEWNDIVYKGFYVGKKDLETVLDYSDKWIEENL